MFVVRFAVGYRRLVSSSCSPHILLLALVLEVPADFLPVNALHSHSSSCSCCASTVWASTTAPLPTTLHTYAFDVPYSPGSLLRQHDPVRSTGHCDLAWRVGVRLAGQIGAFWALASRWPQTGGYRERDSDCICRVKRSVITQCHARRRRRRTSRRSGAGRAAGHARHARSSAESM